MIELVDGFWVDPYAVTAIKKIDDNKCALWVTGQGAMDNFVLEYSAEEVAQAVTDACDNDMEDNDDEN